MGRGERAGVFGFCCAVEEKGGEVCVNTVCRWYSRSCDDRHPRILSSFVARAFLRERVRVSMRNVSD
jgi:hypothetical protein